MLGFAPAGRSPGDAVVLRLGASDFILTKEVGAAIEESKTWEEKDVEERQDRMAKLAVEIWSLRP